MCFSSPSPPPPQQIAPAPPPAAPPSANPVMTNMYDPSSPESGQGVRGKLVRRSILDGAYYVC